MPPPLESAATIEHIAIPGPGHRLHGLLAYPPDGDPCCSVVLAGPHPLLGGTMHNNVVRALGDGLAERGMLTLRFDYRGVGQSEGPRFDVAEHLAEFWHTSHVADELDLAHDVQAAVEFIQEAAGTSHRIVLVGYSFGCALLPLVRVPQPAYVLIAPTIAKHDYAAFIGRNAPTQVITSEDDFASDTSRLRAWFDGLTGPRSLILRRFDNHFFRGHENWLADSVCEFLREVLPLEMPNHA
jgi:alpha/beta superfamily hydrolase